MPARRCAPCGEYWPNSTHYVKCPLCRKATTFLPLSNPEYTNKQAEEYVKEEQFRRYYARYDAQRKGPTPEELGAVDAVEELEIMASFMRTWKEIQALP